jgi:ubiquinone/menaquinone biosynthesis C-methylase UbiE
MTFERNVVGCLFIMEREMTNDAKVRAASVYNTCADTFDAPPLGFWDRIGRHTVERLSLKSGASVLDVCCGTGASALPAAEAVGAKGRVLGVDLAENLLQLARAKASQRGLAHAAFRCGDLEALDPAVEMFDAVVCVFGIFFLPDMAAGVRTLWRLVRPGGQLAITTWGPRTMEPGNSAFWDAVRVERPELYKGYNPWDSITDPPAVRALLHEGGVQTDDVIAEAGTQPLKSPEDFWTILLGSGYRATIEQLDTVARDRVRLATLHALSTQNVRGVEANAVYAIARKA